MFITIVCLCLYINTSSLFSQLLSVCRQEVPGEPPLGVYAPGVREAVAGAVDHCAHRVVGPAEALLAQRLLGHLEIVFGHLPLLLLLRPDQVELLLDNHFVMIPLQKMNIGVVSMDLGLDFLHLSMLTQFLASDVNLNSHDDN